MKRVWMVLLCLALLAVPAEATVKWVDFDLSCEAMERALSLEEQSREQDNPQSWIQILALAATQCGGNPKPADVTAASRSLTGEPPTRL